MTRFLRQLTHTLILWPFFAGAQSIGNYAVTRTTGITYSSISTSGNAVNLWRNNTGAYQQDDNRSNFINIGFDFWYDGTRYTQVSVSTNGFLDFSGSTDDGSAATDDFGYLNSAFSAAAIGSATRPALAPFYDDLTAQGASAPLGNSIRYLLTGTSPNRVFTVEWLNMAVYTNTTPSLNYQIKLYETSGIIEFIYGTMNTGTFSFTYTLGINGPTVSASPAITELKNQNTANTTTFSNTPQNNLVTVPASNSRIRFTPPVPLNPTGTMTFSSVTSTSMNVNFPNWASNEIGYLVWNSTDGVNYSFVAQTAANATTASITGLLPSTTYFWRVYAVTEGCLSNSLNGTQATLAGINKVSNVTTGNWNTPGSWLPVGVPTTADNVIILNGHTITVNTDVNCNNLTVGSGTSGILRLGNNGTSRDINVNNNITVNNGAQFIANTASNTTHQLNVKGNIVNNGTIDFATDGNSFCTANFIKNGNQSISGTGAVNAFYTMTVNMGTSETNTLSVTSTNFSAPNDFLILQNGTFKLANTAATTLNLFTPATSAIGPTTGFTLANANATVSILGNLDLQGNLRLEAGTLNVGNAVNENLTSNGGEITITGGTLNVAGRYTSSTINNLSRFVMSGGTMVVPFSGSTSSTTEAPFNITSPGSVVTISGGTIIIPREGGTGAQNLGFIISGVINSSVTGGTLQIGNAGTPANQIMQISTTLPVGNLLVNSNNARAQQATSLTVLANVDVTLGTLDLNNLDMMVGGNWTDNGTFITGTASTVIFNGSDLQTITDPSGEHFNNLSCSSTDTVRLLTNLDIDANLIINAGSTLDAGPSNQTIDIQRHWTKTGNFYSRQGLVNFNGTLFQNITGTGTTHFFNLRTANTAGVNVVSGTYELEGAYTPTSGTFNVSGATSFTLLSDAVRTARIATAGTGTVSGTMRIQRYISARAAGYSDISSPVVSSTFADWDNELLLVYAYSPPDYYPSAYSYDEALWDYVPVTVATEVLTPGKGFEVYLDSYGTYTTFDNTTLDTRGTPTIGNVNISSTLTNANDGWNLVGNPYASFVKWNNLYTASSGVSNTIMIYDEVTADFELQTAASGYELPPHQGFWIQATSGSPAVTFRENQKTTTSNSTFKMAPVANFSLTIKSDEREHFFTSKTQFVSMMNGNFTEDVLFKGLPHPLAPKLYSVKEDKPYRLLHMDEAQESMEIALGFSVGENGMYSISAAEVEQVRGFGYNCIVLTDHSTGASIQLTDGNKYHFYATTTDAKDRFSLSLSKKGGCTSFTAPTGVVFMDAPSKVSVVIDENTSAEVSGTVQVMNLMGQPVGNPLPVYGAGYYSVTIPDVNTCYLVVVRTGGNTFVHKYVNR